MCTHFPSQVCGWQCFFEIKMHGDSQRLPCRTTVGPLIVDHNLRPKLMSLAKSGEISRNSSDFEDLYLRAQEELGARTTCIREPLRWSKRRIKNFEKIFFQNIFSSSITTHTNPQIAPTSGFASKPMDFVIFVIFSKRVALWLSFATRYGYFLW